MNIGSILGDDLTVFPMPDYFSDLNLDQVAGAITRNKKEYELDAIFYSPAASDEVIKFRQAVMQDIERPEILESVDNFAATMHSMRAHLDAARQAYLEPAKRALFLEAVYSYSQALSNLSLALSEHPVSSLGLKTLESYLAQYLASPWFQNFYRELVDLRKDLSSIRYCLFIRGGSVTVRPYDNEKDYASEVIETFERFRQGDVKSYTMKIYERTSMNHVEAQIFTQLGRLYPQVFSRLDHFYHQYQKFLDPTIEQFDREVQFYVAYANYIAPLKDQGLPFCYPRVSNTMTTIRVRNGFDVALARKLLSDGQSIVLNDFFLEEGQRIFVVSGPNQGGKTTFARMFGQLHYLANLGLPVPGSEANLLLFDHLFTHFDRVEHIEDLRSKLQDDLIRVHDIITHATSRSIILLNEIFSSTSLEDATVLSRKILEMIRHRGALCVVVTFIEELSTLGPDVVSMVSSVVPDHPEMRTYRILREPADGLSYAMALAQKYGLTADQLRGRIHG